MKTNIQVFTNDVFGKIRTCQVNNQIMFVGKDVAQALGYKNPSNALHVHVDGEDKTSYLIQVSGSNYKTNTLFINESGLYSLILSSTGQGLYFDELLIERNKHGAIWLHFAVRQRDRSATQGDACQSKNRRKVMFMNA